jgi:hypothetical protein
MRQLKKIMFVLILLGQSCTEVTDSQFESILTAPDKFQGQKVEITGVMHEQLEDYAIYLSTHSEKDKAIWVNFSEKYLRLGRIDGLKIKITGTFNKNDKGHLGQYAGSLDEARMIKIE